MQSPKWIKVEDSHAGFLLDLIFLDLTRIHIARKGSSYRAGELKSLSTWFGSGKRKAGITAHDNAPHLC